MAEMVRKGYKADQIAKIIAGLLNCSERTVRNKIKNITDFTVTEALTINAKLFNNQFDLRYLFSAQMQKGQSA